MDGRDTDKGASVDAELGTFKKVTVVAALVAAGIALGAVPADAFIGAKNKTFEFSSQTFTISSENILKGSVCNDKPTSCDNPLKIINFIFPTNPKTGTFEIYNHRIIFTANPDFHGTLVF